MHQVSCPSHSSFRIFTSQAQTSQHLKLSPSHSSFRIFTSQAQTSQHLRLSAACFLLSPILNGYRNFLFAHEVCFFSQILYSYNLMIELPLDINPFSIIWKQQIKTLIQPIRILNKKVDWPLLFFVCLFFLFFFIFFLQIFNGMPCIKASTCSREASDAGEFHLKTKSRDFRVIFDEK